MHQYVSNGYQYSMTLWLSGSSYIAGVAACNFTRALLFAWGRGSGRVDSVYLETDRVSLLRCQNHDPGSSLVCVLESGGAGTSAEM